MAYGSGTSLSGLSFTPVVAIYNAKYSDRNIFSWTVVAIKGCYAIGSATLNDGSSCSASYCICKFNTNSVEFTNYRGYAFYSYNPYIAAFGT